MKLYRQISLVVDYLLLEFQLPTQRCWGDMLNIQSLFEGLEGGLKGELRVMVLSEYLWLLNETLGTSWTR